MTMGPAPMMRMLLMSRRLGMPRRHHVDEALEEIIAVLRAGTRLGMILHGEHRPIPEAQALIAAVEKRDMRDLRLCREGFGEDAEAVVLAGDLDLAGGEVLDGVIGAAMPDRHLLCLAAERQRQQLVAQADAEDGFPRAQQL